VKTNVKNLTERIRAFADERDWEQFHSPKNLTMALSVEVAELMEHFMWMTQDESRNLEEKKLSAVKEEIGDSMIYLLRLADQLGIDPLDSAEQKLVANGRKYPVEKARGNAKKYDEF
jgi:NTP pyrophosphatase (non-canonical NTP hydrolase)